MQLDFTRDDLFKAEGDYTLMRKTKVNGALIIGYYGCYCHPFNTVEDLNKAQRQRFNPGQYIIERCGGKRGIVTSTDGQWVHVTIGPLGRDQVCFHKTNIYLNPLQK